MKPKYSETDIAIERHDGLLKKSFKDISSEKLKLTFQIKGPLGRKKNTTKTPLELFKTSNDLFSQ